MSPRIPAAPPFSKSSAAGRRDARGRRGGRANLRSPILRFRRLRAPWAKYQAWCTRLRVLSASWVDGRRGSGAIAAVGSRGSAAARGR
eukprot:9502346-Pyramimonas_sp.AAC.2